MRRLLPSDLLVSPSADAVEWSSKTSLAVYSLSRHLACSDANSRVTTAESSSAGELLPPIWVQFSHRHWGLVRAAESIMKVGIGMGRLLAKI